MKIHNILYLSLFDLILRLNIELNKRFNIKNDSLLFTVYVSYKHTQAMLTMQTHIQSVFLHMDLCTALVVGLHSLLT